MWGTDMTTTVTVGAGAACVFVAVDHCTTECIGLHAAKRGSRFEALEPIRQGIRERFGGIGAGVARGLRLRHDHGSNDLADDFQQGTETSPSLCESFGVGANTAAELLILCGDNPTRIRSEAAFAKLCGAWPIPASSGRTTGRHRLYRGGHRRPLSSRHRPDAIPPADRRLRRTPLR